MTKQIVSFSHTDGGIEYKGLEECPLLSQEMSHVERILAIILASPVLDLSTAFRDVGLEKMCGMEEMGKLKKILTDGGLRLDGNRAPWGTLEHPYFWTRDYYGIAPAGHPAAGCLILAQISDVVMHRSHGQDNELDRMFSGPGAVIPSKTEYEKCLGSAESWMMKAAREHHRGCPEAALVEGFTKCGNMMIPVAQHRYEADRWKIHPYGLVYPSSAASPCAIALRPSNGNNDLGFVGYDGPTKLYRIVRRDWLMKHMLL